MYYRLLAASAAFLLIFPGCAQPSQASSDIDLLSMALGYYDANDDDNAIDLRLEYRFGQPIIADLKSWLGLEATSDGAFFAAGGLLYDWEFTDNLYFVPSFGAGFYSDGSGKDLGNTIQFRTQLEFQYELENNNRVSLAASHISNGDLASHNPGTEVISLYYSVPLNGIF